jgi:pentatricopeptide repeat protein
VRAQLAAMAPGTVQLDMFSWNRRLARYVKAGQHEKTIELYQEMQQKGMSPDNFTFVPVLNACASLRALEAGRKVHEEIIQSGCKADVFVGSSLVDMYSKCGSIEDACKVFNNMPSRDVVTWNAMILGHVKCGQGQKALELFHQMQQKGVQPTPVTLIGVLNACASMFALQEGRCTHEQIIESGWESDVFVGSSLVDMYAKCGSMEDAERVFNKMLSRNVVTWDTMILGYVKCGQGSKALELFQQMQQEGVQSDPVTFVGVLNACASMVALEEGRHAHEQIIQSGYESVAVVGNSLIDMYAKCGSIEDAKRVFNKLPSRDVVSWNVMIFGHVKYGQGQKALELFRQMQEEGVQPTPLTLVGVLNACASVVALEEGRRTHDWVIKSGWDSNVFVGNSLIDMYAKCGSLVDALKVFNKMPSRDVVTWNAMIGGYAIHGHGKEALKQFEQMREEGVQPDDTTFVCLLSACSHSGLVDEGLRFYSSMSTVYMISANLQHYTCMVDLLGRAGRLHEAENMVLAMPYKPQVAAWMALLGACRIHGNVEMGERVAKQVLELEPENAAGYVLLSNLYTATGNRDLSKNIERQRKERSVKKHPGRTWIEVDNEVHTFVVDDQHHPQMIEIHAELKRLSGLMHDAGYVPDTNFVLHDVEEEEKVFHLCHHSEKLAIAFGLINSAPGTPLCIRKNLRVCRDCHTSTKFISKVVGRAIMVRDANRFHHFQDGECSCRDYW